MKVRIIVLNYNGAELLPLCVPSLVQAAEQASFPTGITLLDNRSTDQGVAWVKKHFPQVAIQEASKNQCLVSYNEYLRTIEEDIVILLNNDMRVANDFVDPLVRVFEEHPDAFLASPQSFTFDGTRYNSGRSRAQIRWGLFWSSVIFPGYEILKEIEGPTFASGSGAFERKRFLALGGYDDLYLPGIMEDSDLGFRAWREGYRSYYIPKSHVYHMGQESFKKAFGKSGIATLAHRNSFLFIWKNITQPKLFLAHFLFLIPRILFSLLQGKPELFVGFFQALSRIPEALSRRKFLPKKRARTDSEIFRLANGEPPTHRYLFKKKWKRAAMGLFDSLCSPFLLFPHKRKTPSPERVLMIRLDSLGDGVLALPAIHALTQRFPGAQVDFLVNTVNRDLFSIFYPHSNYHVLKSNCPFERLRMAGRLKQRRYQLGVDFRGDVLNILLMTLAGIPHRWGRRGTGGAFLLTRQIPNPHQKHELLENLELVQTNGLSERIHWPVFQGRKTQFPMPEKPIVIHVGAGYPSKRWRPDYFLELAEKISEMKLGNPVFIGTEEEGKFFGPYRARIEKKFVDLTGKTTLPELVDAIAQSNLFIGNDSGPAHLAALLNRKMVVVFSGTNDFKRWAPWSSTLRILNHPVPCSPCEEKVCPLNKQICLEEISVDEVLHAVKESLTH